MEDPRLLFDLRCLSNRQLGVLTLLGCFGSKSPTSGRLKGFGGLGVIQALNRYGGIRQPAPPPTEPLRVLSAGKNKQGTALYVYTTM